MAGTDGDSCGDQLDATATATVPPTSDGERACPCTNDRSSPNPYLFVRADDSDLPTLQELAVPRRKVQAAGHATKRAKCSNDEQAMLNKVLASMDQSISDEHTRISEDATHIDIVVNKDPGRQRSS